MRVSLLLIQTDSPSLPHHNQDDGEEYQHDAYAKAHGERLAEQRDTYYHRRDRLKGTNHRRGCGADMLHRHNGSEGQVL